MATHTPYSHNHHHQLVRLAIVGGFLDGQCFDFAQPLNCLIGARGTGKTTVLEFIRWVMDAMPTDPAERERIENLVIRNLKGGRVDLTVQTKDGLRYTVSRAPGEEPIVKTQDGRVTDISLKAGGLFRVDVFSQNEVEAIADRPTSQLDLLDAFEPTAIADLGAQLAEVLHRLQINASHAKPLQSAVAGLVEAMKGKEGLEAQLASLSAEGGESADVINTAHQHKSLRDREGRVLKSIGEAFKEVDGKVRQMVGMLANRGRDLVTDELSSGPNATLMTDLSMEYAACAEVVDQHLAAALAAVDEHRTHMREVASRLMLAHREQETAFQVLLEHHKEAQEKATERCRLERARNDLLAKARELERMQAQVVVLGDERRVLMDRLTELRDQRYALRKSIAHHINSLVGPAIRVQVEQCGDQDAYVSLVERAVKGPGVHAAAVARKVTSALSPAQLVDHLRRQDRGALREIAGLNDNQTTKLLERFGDDEGLAELETVELADLPTIELNDNGAYKATAVLSTGQKCTSILPILLINSDCPLLVDQPEDNLDNRFVFEHIVRSIRTVKQHRQLFFVTHNPNIPVLGDAEQVFVLESDGKQGRLRACGGVDSCQADIVTLLEGGADAFRRRGARYQAEDGRPLVGAESELLTTATMGGQP